MQKLANTKPSATLSDLKSTAHLSNIVSKQALDNAVELWRDYIDTPNCHRDADDALSVANELRLIITQVCQRRCRINPCAWYKLTTLEANIRQAVKLGVKLEPNTNMEVA